jgi:hypothetical protein
VARGNSILTEKVLASVGKLLSDSRLASPLASGAGADSAAADSLAGCFDATVGNLAR